MSPPILIYAELLSNIRQVSVGCNLQTPSSSSTKAVVTSDGSRFAISHDGVEQSVLLPGRVNSPTRLPVPKIGAKTLAWRFPVASATVANSRPTMEDQTVPWSASDLQPGSAIRCRACGAIVVKQDTLKVWKDLPSENWAEMMEFWHCHKPHGHDHDDESLAQKAYGANSRISAQPGVGFVDLASFLISETDIDSAAAKGLVSAFLEAASDFLRDLPKTWKSCDYLEEHATQSNDHLRSNHMVTHDLTLLSPNGDVEDHSEVTTNRTSEKTLASCSACNRVLGISNEKASSITLFKWRVSLNQQEPQNPQNPHTEPSLAQCVSAILLATMARTGCSKSILMPIETAEAISGSEPSAPGQDIQSRLLNIWVFNGNITFSSTEEPRSPLSAVKVLYRLVSQEEADKMLDSMTSDVQDIALPADAISGILGILARSNGMIPESDRHFKEWTVGLVEKWISPEVARGQG